MGFRPATPDNTPVIGLGAVEGLVWATGHHRNGILLAPLTAELITEALVGVSPRDRPRMGRSSDLPAGATVAGALGRLGLARDARGVAVAVDGEVVPRAAWESFALVRRRPCGGAHRDAGRMMG